MSKEYIVTVKYGKERRAELELGDAIFPFDDSVTISITKFKGVLKLITKLDFNELIRVLSVYPPSTVERIVPVGVCCSGDDYRLLGCILSYAKSCKFEKYRFGRKGRLGDDLIRKIAAELNKMAIAGTKVVLHIEPVNDEVCLGVTGVDEDKFYLIRDKRIKVSIPKYRK